MRAYWQYKWKEKLHDGFATETRGLGDQGNAGISTFISPFELSVDHDRLSQIEVSEDQEIKIRAELCESIGMNPSVVEQLERLKDLLLQELKFRKGERISVVGYKELLADLGSLSHVHEFILMIEDEAKSQLAEDAYLEALDAWRLAWESIMTDFESFQYHLVSYIRFMDSC